MAAPQITNDQIENMVVDDIEVDAPAMDVTDTVDTEKINTFSPSAIKLFGDDQPTQAMIALAGKLIEDWPIINRWVAGQSNMAYYMDLYSPNRKGNKSNYYLLQHEMFNSELEIDSRRFYEMEEDDAISGLEAQIAYKQLALRESNLMDHYFPKQCDLTYEIRYRLESAEEYQGERDFERIKMVLSYIHGSARALAYNGKFDKMAAVIPSRPPMVEARLTKEQRKEIAKKEAEKAAEMAGNAPPADMGDEDSDDDDANSVIANASVWSDSTIKGVAPSACRTAIPSVPVIAEEEEPAETTKGVEIEEKVIAWENPEGRVNWIFLLNLVLGKTDLDLPAQLERLYDFYNLDSARRYSESRWAEFKEDLTNTLPWFRLLNSFLEYFTVAKIEDMKTSMDSEVAELAQAATDLYYIFALPGWEKIYDSKISGSKSITEALEKTSPGVPFFMDPRVSPSLDMLVECKCTGTPLEIPSGWAR